MEFYPEEEKDRLDKASDALAQLIISSMPDVDMDVAYVAFCKLISATMLEKIKKDAEQPRNREVFGFVLNTSQHPYNVRLKLNLEEVIKWQA